MLLLLSIIVYYAILIITYCSPNLKDFMKFYDVLLEYLLLRYPWILMMLFYSQLLVIRHNPHLRPLYFIQTSVFILAYISSFFIGRKSFN
ncbi:Protein CBG26043 [Caenorhabditis briggsae]|uniref:Protein CBG26043 n=1 Tax=Caenorhabditis briggsae TaxID=6238 RepID=B6IHD4_CAEBR|nr:Protein CBG26043 [Caenorhabditis briggsae]CAR99314.1 Protein CBG26043 [Caenorhabditis briggsae]